MPHRLLADQLAADPRVAQAKALLLEALADHQGRLTGVRAPDPDLGASYDEVVRAFAQVRGAPLYFPYVGSGLGRGALVELADGSVKYDFISGIGVHALGHSHADLTAAAIDAALSDTIMQGNLQQNRESLDLARTLLAIANRGDANLGHCFLTTSGAMANENALKMLFQKKHPASRLLAFGGCFAGRTLALAQVTDRPEYRQGLPTTIAVDSVPFFDARDPGASTQRSLGALRDHLRRFPRQHAAMCFELIQGEGGFVPGDRDFFISLMETLREHEIPIFIDEVQTFGRTTQPFAFQHFDLDAFVDIVTVGKLTQVCATLFASSLVPGPGLLSQTFTGSTASIQAARVILDTLRNGGFFGPGGRIAAMEDHFRQRLSQLSAQYPDRIRGPFGLGAMVAFTAFDGSPQKSKEVVQALFGAGVIAFVAGQDPARVRFLVPIAAVQTKDIDAVCDILAGVLENLGSGVR